MFFSLVTFILLVFASSVAEFENKDVNFYLVSSQNPENYVEIGTDYTLVDRNSSVIVFIHGWMENWNQPWYNDLKNAYLSKPAKTSIILVDWSKLAGQIFYPHAVFDTRKAGKVIGDFIISLVKSHNVLISNIHIVGASLGGHVAGFAGKYIQSAGLKLPRITALDAAGILFSGFFVSDNSRLSKDDAEVVVAIHTDTWKLGYLEPFGSVDIYPNGLPLIQPGCPDNAGNNWAMCSHQRSHQYFIDAVENPGTLVSTQCWSFLAFLLGHCKENKQLDLGGEVGGDDIGKYYIATNPKKPYGKGP